MFGFTRKKTLRHAVTTGSLAAALLVGLSVPTVASTSGTVGGDITIPSGASTVSACAFVTDLEDVFLEVCTADGDTEYLVSPVPPGQYHVQFYSYGDELASQWHDGVSNLHDSTLVTVVAGQTTVVNANLEFAGEITGTISHSEDASTTGGCVEVYTVSGHYVTETCPIGADYVVGSLPAGSYKLRFTGFNNSSFLFYPSSRSFESAGVVTVGAGGTASADVTLSPGGTISGQVTRPSEHGSGWWLPHAFANLYTVGTVEFVTQVQLSAHGNYTFYDVPHGDYYVLFNEVHGYGDRWYRVDEAQLTPSAVSIPGPGAAWDQTGIDQELSWDVSIQGYLNTPRSWNEPHVCAIVVESGHVIAPTTFPNRKAKSVFCAEPGSWFLVDRVPFFGLHRFLLFSDGYGVNPSGYVINHPSVPVLPYGGPINSGFGVPFTYTHSGTSTVLTVFLFTDIDADMVGWENIYWMGDVGISEGYADGSYKPDNRVIRKHMALFMYRLMGQPGFELPPSTPFSDVKTTEAGYDAMAWMADTGISVGYHDGTYRPNNFVTRKHMALFMYRLAGEPAFALPASSPFKDVNVTDAGYVAMAWMAVTGISEGYHDGTFKPNNFVSRKHMAFFMKRFYDNVL